MKRHQLIKSLLFAPLVAIPLVATASCGSSGGSDVPASVDEEQVMPSQPAVAQVAAANGLLAKFKADQASNFITFTDSRQRDTYSNIIFSTDKNDRTKAPTQNYFLNMIKSSKTTGVPSGDKTTYTYDGGGAPYLYIFAQLNLQDPDGEQGDLKKTEVLIAEFNENFTVSVKNSAKATDSGDVTLTGYKSGDEVNEFKLTTSDSNFYIANMLYTTSLAAINDETGAFLNYDPAYSKLTSTSPSFVANKTFEDKAAGTLAYASNKITYSSTDSGAGFNSANNNPILTGATFTFKKLKYNLDLTTGRMTIAAPATLTIS